MNAPATPPTGQIVSFGEVLLQRIALEPSVCGAEANVAVALAGFGHGLVTGMDRDGTITFATACSEGAHSAPGDFLRASVSDIVAMGAGGGDVRR